MRKCHHTMREIQRRLARQRVALRPYLNSTRRRTRASIDHYLLTLEWKA